MITKAATAATTSFWVSSSSFQIPDPFFIPLIIAINNGIASRSGFGTLNK